MGVETNLLELSEDGTYTGAVQIYPSGGQMVFKDPAAGEFTLSDLSQAGASDIGELTGLGTDYADGDEGRTMYYNAARLADYLADATNASGIAITPDVGGNATLAAHVADASIHQTSASHVFEVCPTGGKKYTSITAALVASDALGGTVHKELLLWPGTYDETPTVAVANTHIVGLVPEATILKHDSTGQTITAGGTGAGQFALRALANNCSFQGLTINNPSSSTTVATALSIGSSAVAVTGVVVRGCVFQSGGGVGYRGVMVWNSASSVTFEDCETQCAGETPYCYGTLVARRCRLYVAFDQAAAVGLSGGRGDFDSCTLSGYNSAFFMRLSNATAGLNNCSTSSSPAQQLYSLDAGQTASYIYLSGTTAMHGGLVGGGSVSVTGFGTVVPREMELVPAGSATAGVQSLDAPALKMAAKYWDGSTGDSLLEATDQLVVESFGGSGDPHNSVLSRVLTIDGVELLRATKDGGSTRFEVCGGAFQVSPDGDGIIHNTYSVFAQDAEFDANVTVAGSFSADLSGSAEVTKCVAIGGFPVLSTETPDYAAHDEVDLTPTSLSGSNSVAGSLWAAGVVFKVEAGGGVSDESAATPFGIKLGSTLLHEETVSIGAAGESTAWFIEATVVCSSVVGSTVHLCGWFVLNVGTLPGDGSQLRMGTINATVSTSGTNAFKVCTTNAPSYNMSCDHFVVIRSR